MAINRKHTLFSTLTLSLALGACGGSTPTEPTTPEVAAEVSVDATEEDDDWGFDEEPAEPAHGLPEQSAIETLGFTGPDKPWQKMSFEEQEWYMVGKVHPVMREVFANFNARYADFSCETCHGADGKARKWEMPSNDLSPVPAFDSEDFKAMAGSKMVTFMREEVTKHTAELLGMPAYNPKTGKGFSCFDCHPKE